MTWHAKQHSPTETITPFPCLAGYCPFNLTISEKPPKSSNMSQFKCQHVVGKETNKLNLQEMPKREVIQTVERSLLFSKGKYNHRMKQGAQKYFSGRFGGKKVNSCIIVIFFNLVTFLELFLSMSKKGECVKIRHQMQTENLLCFLMKTAQNK